VTLDANIAAFSFKYYLRQSKKKEQGKSISIKKSNVLKLMFSRSAVFMVVYDFLVISFSTWLTNDLNVISGNTLFHLFPL